MLGSVHIVTHWHFQELCYAAGEALWKPHIRVDINVRLYIAYILPVLMYGSEARLVTKTLAWRLAAFDTRPLRKNPLDPTSTNRDVRVEKQCLFSIFIHWKISFGD